MQLLHLRNPLVQTPIHSRCDSQRPSDHSANTRQEPREGLRSRFAVDDFHGRDIVVEEHAGDTAGGVDALCMPLLAVVAAVERSSVRGYGVLVGFEAAALGEDGPLHA